MATPPSERTRVKRLPERGRYDRETIDAILDEASAKVRTGPPKDEEEDYDLPVWAGELPFRLATGAPVDDPRLEPGIQPPGYVRDYSRQ